MRFLDLRRFSGDLLDVRTSVHTMRFFGREMFFSAIKMQNIAVI